MIIMKTNKKIVVMFFMTLSFVTQARNVDSLTARTMAVSVLTDRGAKTALYDITPAAWRGNLYLYAGEQSGFVLLPADDAVRPILAYSTTGAFPTENIPPQVQVFLQQYVDMVEYARGHNLPQHPDWKRQGSQAKEGGGVGPLLTTAWGQYYPYNTLCPDDPIADPPIQCVTGCAATATAQIMRYWQWPSQGWGQHEYTCYANGYRLIGTLSEQFDTVHYQWDLMPDVLDTLSSEAEIYAVSRLMYDCGVAMEMNYSRDGSGAQPWSSWSPTAPSAGQALRTHFRYHPTLRYVDRDDYTDSEWLDMMQAELDAARPILYCATEASLGAHAIVVDGYDGERRLHFNFGWNGLFDGFYAIDSICASYSSGAGYQKSEMHFISSWQNAVIGIRPNMEECDTATIQVVSSDTLAGYCTGGGQFAYADSVSLTAHAADGYRFDGWYSGSYENPRYLPATASLTDTARFCRIDSDTLYHHTHDSKDYWTWAGTEGLSRWGIRIPAACLHGGQRLSAVQFYQGYTWEGSERLKIYSNSPDEDSPLYERVYDVSEEPKGWVTLAIDAVVAIDTTSDLWIVFETDGTMFDWGKHERSTYGGNSDGCWFYNQDGWNTLDSVGIWATWMIRAVTCPASDPLGIGEIQANASVVAYPNPTTDKVIIEMKSEELRMKNNVSTATLTDMMGRRKEVRLTPQAEGRYSLDLTAHPQGAYFLILTTADGRQHTVRLIK